jgi:hypothetical protein
MDEQHTDRREDTFPGGTHPAETADGRIRWWRPDVQYRVVEREEDSGKLKAALIAGFFLLTGFQWNVLLRADRRREADEE